MLPDLASLGAAISRHWPLDQVDAGQVLQHAHDRTTVAFATGQGEIGVKAYETGRELGLVAPSEDQVNQQLGIHDYLSRGKFRHAPALLPTRDGARFAHVEGLTLVVQERVEGRTPPNVPGSWADLGRIARALNADTTYTQPFAIDPAGAIAELATQAGTYPFAREFLDLVAGLDVLVAQPQCLIHGEINLANAIQCPDGRLVLIDWDQAGRGPRALEAGYPLVTQFISLDLAVDEAAARAFYGAYTGGEGMDRTEQDAVFTAAIFHALRYLTFADTDRRWNRILFAIDHREQLLATVTAST